MRSWSFLASRLHELKCMRTDHILKRNPCADIPSAKIPACYLFNIMSSTTSRWEKGQSKNNKRLRCIGAAAIVGCYGVTDEPLQCGLDLL